jgi:hypothetical protein
MLQDKAVEAIIMTKIIFLLFVPLIMGLITAGCTKIEKNNKPEENSEMREQLFYARYLCFDTNSTLPIGGYSDHILEEAGYNKVVFVNDETEKDGYAENIIVAWPQDLTTRILYSLNHSIAGRKEDISSFGLSYPITIKDVVCKWENVHTLIQSLGTSRQDYLLNPLRGYLEGEPEWEPLPESNQ